MPNDKCNVSEHLIATASMFFYNNFDQLYSRRDIESQFNISKTTAWRLLNILEKKLGLTKDKQRNTVLYKLSESKKLQLESLLSLLFDLTDEERLALNFAIESSVGKNIFGNVLTSLKEKMSKAGMLSFKSGFIRVHSGGSIAKSLDNSAMFDTLISALETKTIIQIKYKSPKSTEPKEIMVWPIGLYILDDKLYLYAYNPNKKGATSFVYSRMIQVLLVEDEHFTIPDNIDFDDYLSDPFGMKTDNVEMVTVRISADQVPYVEELLWIDTENSVVHEDGSKSFTIPVSNQWKFRTWALSLGLHCKVESPKDYADEQKMEHLLALQQYGWIPEEYQE